MTREEAIKILKEDRALYETDTVWAGDGTPDGELLEALDMAIEALSEPPRPKGRWMYNGIASGCDQCEKWLVLEQGTAVLNFCPNCGADMRGEEE